MSGREGRGENEGERAVRRGENENERKEIKEIKRESQNQKETEVQIEARVCV